MTIRLSRLLGAFAVTLLLAATATRAADYSAGDITVTSPWARATSQLAKVAGGFLSITNHGSAPDKLIAIDSDIAGMTMVHKMTMENGVAKMEMLEDLPIPPGETVELKPSSLHIMFMQLKNPLKEGDRFKAVLTFERAGKISIEFVVGGAGAQSAPAP
jgi:copper(I)-binding protein